MCTKVLLFGICFMLSFSATRATDKRLNPSQQITITDGMAHDGVTSIIEDKNGYIWIGTYDGLNRYDGYECKLFKNHYQDEILTSNPC